jgi:hypothetical protein
MLPVSRYPVKVLSPKSRFSLILVDQWGFEASGPQIRAPHMELPMIAEKLRSVSFLADNVLLTRLQTNIQTQTYLIL